MDLPCLPVPGGLEVFVHVSPRSARSAVLGPYGDALKVAVRAAPEKGRGNEEVREVLASFLGIPVGRVQVVGGHASRRKKVRLAGVSPEAWRGAVQAAGRGRKSPGD